MNDSKQIAEDLRYVRHSIEKAEGDHAPAAIYWLWAVISLVGFSLVDWVPERVGLFWMIAAPLGFLLSLWIGYRSARQVGQLDHVEGKAWASHWLVVMITMFLSLLAALTGVVGWRGFLATIVLLSGLAYLLAGVHLERRMIWVGVVLLLAYPAALLLETGVWTGLGVLFAFAMVATAYLGREARSGL